MKGSFLICAVFSLQSLRLTDVQVRFLFPESSVTTPYKFHFYNLNAFERGQFVDGARVLYILGNLEGSFNLKY